MKRKCKDARIEVGKCNFCIKAHCACKEREINKLQKKRLKRQLELKKKKQKESEALEKDSDEEMKRLK